MAYAIQERQYRKDKQSGMHLELSFTAHLRINSSNHQLEHIYFASLNTLFFYHLRNLIFTIFSVRIHTQKAAMQAFQHRLYVTHLVVYHITRNIQRII